MLVARDRFKGLWWGAFAGDALAMPVHGYPDREMIENDYGFISEMTAPREPYPDFVLEGYDPGPLPPEYDYTGPVRREDWKSRTTHPHKRLEAGQNTLPMYLAMHMAASIIENGGFNTPSWLERYRAVMTDHAASYHDTFVPTIHRRYFENLAAGKDPEKNGVAEAHISDSVIFLPLYLYGYAHPKQAHMDLMHAVKKFSIGENTLSTSLFLMEIISHIIAGVKLEDVMYQKMNPDRHYALAYPYRRWIKAGNDDETMADQIGRTAELDKSIVLTLYLALKYGDDCESALAANANIGGETTGRGALLGALIAGQYGYQSIPDRWVDALKMSAEIAGCGNALSGIVFK